jgi:hypothetical protein
MVPPLDMTTRERARRTVLRRGDERWSALASTERENGQTGPMSVAHGRPRELDGNELRPSGAPKPSREGAREADECAGSKKGGERERKLKEDADEERRLECSSVRKVASREEALEVFLERKGKRRKKDEHDQKVARRRLLAAGPGDEPSRADEGKHETKDSREGAVRQVRVARLRERGASSVWVRDGKPVREFVRGKPACDGESEGEEPGEAGPPWHGRHRSPPEILQRVRLLSPATGKMNRCSYILDSRGPRDTR